MQPLISKVFGWVMVMIGAGTGLGQTIGYWLFSSFNFRVESDFFCVTSLLAFVIVVLLERKISINQIPDGGEIAMTELQRSKT